MARTQITTEEASLLIYKISFEIGFNWVFEWNGNEIHAEVLDLDFYQLMEDGKRFRKGDILEGQLRIVKEWDNSANVYLNKSYGVVKVFRHVSQWESDIQTTSKPNSQ